MIERRALATYDVKTKVYLGFFLPTTFSSTVSPLGTLTNKILPLSCAGYSLPRVQSMKTDAWPLDWHMYSTVSYTHLRAHETPEHLVCRLLLEKKKKII